MNIAPTHQYAERITVAWQKTVAAIVETGQLLIQARKDLPDGTFHEMIKRDLPFGPRMAQYLMRIAEHPVLSDAKYISHLPTSVSILIQLQRIEPKLLVQKIDNGTVHPAMRLEDVRVPRERYDQPGALKPRYPKIEGKLQKIPLYPQRAQEGTQEPEPERQVTFVDPVVARDGHEAAPQKLTVTIHDRSFLLKVPMYTPTDPEIDDPENVDPEWVADTIADVASRVREIVESWLPEHAGRELVLPASARPALFAAVRQVIDDLEREPAQPDSSVHAKH